MAGHNGPTTAIYVAADDRCNEIKSAMRLYRGEVRIGSKTGLGDDPMYMSDLAGMLMTEGSGVDVVIFDEQSMSEALHGHQAAMKAIVQILRQGLSKFVMVRVIDEGNVITQNGEGILQKGGAIVLKGLDELGGPWARRFADLVDNGILDHQDPSMVMPVMAGGENDRARRDGIDLVVNDDPFAQFAGRPDDPFAGIGRSDTTEEDEEDEEDEAEWDDDPFRNAQTRETPAVSMNDFLGEYAPDQAMSEEELDRIAEDKRWAEYYDQHGVRPDLQKLARLSIEPEPAWSYEEINLALSQRGSSLFKSRQGRANMGLVKSEMLVNSRYIKTYAETHGVPYSAPTECKIISTYSATGGTGKSLKNDTVIYRYSDTFCTYTPVHLSDIKEGDYILGADGTPTTVLGVFPQGELDVYKVTLRDGRTISCSADHIWTVFDATSTREDKILRHTVDMTTEELLAGGLRIGKQHDKRSCHWKLPGMKCIDYPTIPLELDPYILGLLIGDGTLGNGRNVTLTCASDRQHLVEFIQNRLPANHRFIKVAPHNPNDLRWSLVYMDASGSVNNAYNIYSNEIHHLGLNHRTEHKFIPEEYLHAGEEQRRLLLAGLLDSDGCVKERGQISFTTITERLKDDFCELVRSLGYICSVNEDHREDKYTTGIAYTVNIWTNDNLFLLPEKRERVEAHRQNLPKPRPDRKPVLNPDAPEVDFPIAPYLMGRLCRSTMVEKRPILVTVHSDEDKALIEQEVAAFGCVLATHLAKRTNTHRKFNERSFERCRIVKGKGIKTRTNPIISLLREAGIYGLSTKELYFPESYLDGSAEQRQALLQGIMDSFGKVGNDYAYVTAKNERFRDEFVALAESLGYTVEVKAMRHGGHHYEIVRFLNADPSVFLMSPDRQLLAELSEALSNLGNDDGFIAITDIVKTGEKAPMTCLYVDAPDHLFVAGDYIVTHNTTVAGMIGVQLNWYFNQSVMQHRSTSWVARILVLSLNEFDDLSVKGIGYNNPMGGAADRKNVAELLRRIDECGGDPDWDDIADCFAASTDNYVYYLPSMTLKDRLDLGVEVSADDYKEIIRVCSKFFGFIVLDMPDIMYDHKDGLVEFALNNAHIVVYIMEPNTKSTFILYQLLEGLLDEEGNSIITPDKWMLVLNKYAKADSPYLGYIDDPENYGQVRFEDIADAVKHHFFAIKAIPLTSRRASGSILFGRDPHVKTAARDITDALLEKIDDNDAKQATKRDRRAGLR